MFGSRILILAPHPDDEIVGFCAAACRAQTQGAKIFVLHLTNGCIARETLWPWQRSQYETRVARRLSEAEEAATFLGFTIVRFCDRPARHLWRNMQAVADDIRCAVKEYEIDQLWVPAYEGGNADHDGLNGLCAILKNELPPLLEFSEYNFAGQQKHSQEFPFTTGEEKPLCFSSEERMTKRRALAIYESEACNLGYVQAQRETYRPLAPYDYTRPAHEGVLWYARFHWVPFKHPRVDFTQPLEVCAALSTFAQANGFPAPATPKAPEHKATDPGSAA